MTFEELKDYFTKSKEWFIEKLGKENFVPTNDPNISTHVVRKAASL